MKTSFLLARITLAVAVILTTNLASAGDNGPRPGTVGAALEATNEDGARAAAAGASLYNGMHPEHPMPVLHGDDAIIRGTVENMGAGMPPGQALDKAIKEETKIPETKPAPAPVQHVDRAPVEHNHIDREVIHEHFDGGHVHEGGDDRTTVHDFVRA